MIYSLRGQKKTTDLRGFFLDRLTCNYFLDRLKKPFAPRTQKAFLTKNMVQFTCNYSDPVDALGVPTVTGDQNFNWASSTCIFNNEIYSPSTSIATSTDISIYGSFTAGEVLISLMLFVMIVIELCKMIASGLSAVKTKKKFLGYSGGDVEVREDI